MRLLIVELNIPVQLIEVLCKSFLSDIRSYRIYVHTIYEQLFATP